MLYLSAIIFLPLIGALVIFALLRTPRSIRVAAVVATLIPLALSLLLFSRFDPQAGYMFQERLSWIPQLNIQYRLGVDGLSLPLLLLTALLGFSAVVGSWSITTRVKEYFCWLLLLQTSITGVFASLDFLLFFLFWELELVPMYFLISIWGSGRKEYSAMKYVIFTFVGSAFMLVGILVLYFSAGTFDIPTLIATDLKPVVFSVPIVFFLIFMAFFIKLPTWPLHTWLPDAHTDAPTAVSVMLAGVLLKMGGYGMLRISVNLFPEFAKSIGWLFALLAVINILYGAAVTVRQRDLKRLIAYSSVSHMGFVLLGISSFQQAGLTGASLQLFTHGTITGLLFLLVGLVYEKAHTRHIPDLGGVASRMPFIAVIFLIAGLASLGLPTTSGFVAEVTVFLGTFPVQGLATILGTIGIVLTAGYILWTLERVLFGPAKERFAHVPDCSKLEAVPLVALAASIVIVGVFPAVLSDVFNAGVTSIVTRLG